MAHKIYENFILENKLTDLLETNVNLNAYMTVDTTLSESAGMKKTINVYSVTGNAEDLAMGEGNTGELEVSFTPVEYEVTTTQAKFSYFDEQEETDPFIVDTGLKAISATMTNDLTEKAIEEYGKATLAVTYSTNIEFNTVVDAIAQLNTEDETGMFMFVNPNMKASLRKGLKDDLVYNSDFVVSGYIGTVAGVNVICSKAVADDTAYLAKKEAITCFVKKNSETETERDADHRKNTIYGRKVMLVALTDSTKVVKITKA